jgi:dihydropteroate synthase
MFTLNCRGTLVSTGKPLVMGVLNITPDSFYKGSRVQLENILQTAENMLAEGGDILDIGGQSTRPSSEPLDAQAELARLLPAVRAIHGAFPASIISIDTFFATVASQCVESGASMVNDISAGSLDPLMIPTVGRLRVPYIAMHMKGTPQTMQSQAHYENLVTEITDYFIGKIAACMDAGITDIIIDPGFGFAKTVEQNFQLLARLEQLQVFDRPLMAGLSRKSTVYKTLDTTPEEALNGTTVMNTMALMKGVNILRVHDVKQAREAVELFWKTKNSHRPSGIH